MTTFEANSWLWMPDDKEMYLPVKVVKSFKPGEEGHGKYEDGKAVTIPVKVSVNCIPMDEAALLQYENMIKLNDLNEPTILHNLRKRFLQDSIYTYVSSILVACNPFKLLPIYTPEVLDRYKDGGGRHQPPHIFAIADNAYRNLLAEYRDQAVVISGESGAGKTETMKLVLQFLAEVSGRAQKQSSSSDKQESLEQQILKSNPLMEAFGNAKTTRNNNSSRFGKWTEIKFNRTGAIVGGSITNYLLEKSRIPFQAQNERNYHIFYQLLAGAELDPATKKSYRLKDAEDFHYMNQSGVTTVDTINDEKDWLEMTNAMDVLNMTPAEKEQVFRLIAAVLQLGNLEFDRDPKGVEETDAKVKNPDQLAITADLLKIEVSLLGKALCYRKITRPGSKSITYAHYSITKATDARDATSKALYGKLFDWLIFKINVALHGMVSDYEQKGREALTTIGVLDIFGFESFATNSFEQLCINYCNEKLQFHFNEYIFKLEQEEYRSEGIPVDLIEFKDNQPTLDLLEAKTVGVFSMIDEEIAVPKGSDETFLKKVLAKHAKHPNFAAPKPKDLNAHLVFIIIHYAGAVPYNVTAFLEKDKDALNEDLIDAVNTSKDPLVSKLLRLSDEESDTTGKAKKKQPTLGSQFRSSLDALMATLYRCEPHFVRCMKSNHQKKGNIFESDMMMAQLRYAGLLEVCRIRKIGFPVRKKFDEFLFRYRSLDLLAAKDHVTLCKSLEKKGLLESRQWAIGHTKVFMRNLQQTKLEEAREIALKDVVKKMQAGARRFICRCRYLKYKAILDAIQKAIAKRTEEALEAALSEIAELPFGGMHVALVKQAIKLKERLEEERRVTTMCQEAIKARDLAELKNAVKAAEDIVYESPVVAEARALRDLMEREKAAVKRLKDAIKERQLDELAAAIEAGKVFGKYVTDTDVYKQAISLKERIEAENAARKALKKAMKARHLEDLTAALNRCSELGLDEDVVKEGQQLKEELEEQRRSIGQLKEVMKARVLEPLQAAIKRCKKVGVPEDDPDLVEGLALEARLVEEKTTEDELNNAADAKDMPRIEAALKKAKKMGIPEESPGLKKATKMKERITAELACIEALKKAIKVNKPAALFGAINTANELSLECKEVEQAKEALQKLGAQTEALLRLENAVASAELDTIDKCLKEVEKMGLGDEDQVKNAREAKKKIVKQNKLAEALEEAIGKRKREPIKQLLADGEQLNLSKRFSEVVDRANKLLDLMDLEDATIKSFPGFVDNNDEEGFEEAVDKAKAAGCAEKVFAEAEKTRAVLAERRAFQNRLVEALEADEKDKELLQQLLDEAKEMGIDNAKTQQAVQIINRDKYLKETRKALKKAMKAMDERTLAEAVEKAISLGMKGEEVEKAKSLQARLDEEKELAAGVRAALKATNVKADSKNGVSSADLEPLVSAMEEAKAQGLSDDSPFMKQAKAAQERIEAVLVVQGKIANALSDQMKLRQMKKVLDEAEELGLENSSLVKKLRAKVREAEKERNKSSLTDGPEEVEIGLNEDEMKHIREEKMRKASHPKYHFSKFSKIRNPDDFASGVILSFNKKKVKAWQLRWQPNMLHTSILDYASKDLSKIATRIHKSVLGYSGDKSMSFPATLAQDILQKGLETPELVDEIYVQLCKHLTNNPRPESAVRGWQLMCMCVGTFPPSRDFENYLLNFILEHKDGAGAIGNYARYSLRRLEGILNSGPSGFVPSVEEIQSYKERPPILATIELVDGTPLTEDLPVTPDLTVGKVLDICTHFLELADARMQYFGIFVEDVDDPDAPAMNPDSEDSPPYAGLPKTPRPLQTENFMGDVVTVKVRQNQPFKFVFKRKIFLKNLDGPSEDPMFERLIYLQAVDEAVNGNIPIDSEDEVASLAAQAMAVDLADEMPADEESLVEADLVEYIPKPWRDSLDMQEWAGKVLVHRETVLDMEPDEVQGKFVDAVRDHPLYGTCFFHVRKHRFPEQMESYPEHIIIALNSEGLHFLNEDRETLASFGYADIYRWGGSSTQFSIIIWNSETQETDDVSMFTSQAADMAALILDYINAIMATTDS